MYYLYWKRCDWPQVWDHWCTWAHPMIVASESRDDDQPHIALKEMSVFDHNFDTHLISFKKKHIAALGLLQYWAPSSPSTNGLLKNVPRFKIFSLTTIQYDWFFKNLRHSRIFSLYKLNTIYLLCNLPRSKIFSLYYDSKHHASLEDPVCHT